MMPLELEADEEIGAGLRRVVEELARESSSLIRRSQSHQAVHETRKSIKKLRAILRLMRRALDDDFSSENRSLRDTSRGLAGVRDAQVLVQTIAKLGELCVEQGSRAAFRRSRARLMPGAAIRRGSLKKFPARKIARELAKFLERATKWPFESMRSEDLAESLERLYRKGRTASRVAASHPNMENFHEWRKRVKDFWYSVRLLKLAWPGMMEALASELKRLSDLLGEDHDLAVLRERLATNSAAARAEDFFLLRKVIDQRQGELQRSAIALGKRLYLESPSAFAQRIGGYWETDK
ncbi:MAG: CHAD domain-containing protein [Verrucomicrobiales bacterium]